jgi:RNA polymerase sigma-70 factor, ECF subfamily
MMGKPETFESYRPLLFSIAYRMLGSAMEAEDIVQEAYLRYQGAQEIQMAKPYLTTIVTRLCLDHLKSAKTQREDYVGTWLPEPILTSDSPDTLLDKRESISMAFLVLLENLSPVERAIFLLRDVFDYSYAEIAAMVDKSEANCRRYYHRAKEFLTERRPRFEPSSTEQIKLIESFLQALVSGDIENLTQMLTDEVTLQGDGGGKKPAIRKPFMGREAIIAFLIKSVRLAKDDFQVEVVEINGTPSLLVKQAGKAYLAMTFTIADGKIHAIRNILNPDKLAYIGQQNQN